MQIRSAKLCVLCALQVLLVTPSMRQPRVLAAIAVLVLTLISQVNTSVPTALRVRTVRRVVLIIRQLALLVLSVSIAQGNAALP